MSDLPSNDYYKILGVSKSSDEKELKKFYQKLQLKWHPDKNQDKVELAEDNFKKISEAYEILNDPEKRLIYDQFGKLEVLTPARFIKNIFRLMEESENPTISYSDLVSSVVEDVAMEEGTNYKKQKVISKLKKYVSEGRLKGVESHLN